MLGSEKRCQGVKKTATYSYKALTWERPASGSDGTFSDHTIGGVSGLYRPLLHNGAIVLRCRCTGSCLTRSGLLDAKGPPSWSIFRP